MISYQNLNIKLLKDTMNYYNHSFYSNLILVILFLSSLSNTVE